MPEVERNKTPKVVIIEDEQHLLEALRDQFEDSYDVKVFSSMDEALAWLDEEHSYDVIISDLNLPQKTGRDLYQHLKEKGHGAEKKIIFMTGGIFTAELSEWFASIPNYKFQKPFNINKLRELLETMT